MSYRSILISFVMMGCIILAAWSTLSTQHHSIDPSHSSDDRIDAFMEEFNATIMNKEGKVHMKISAPHMQHYPNDDRAELTSPKVVIFRHSLEPWYITSQLARSLNGIDQIELINDVVINHSADANTPSTTVKTSHLTLYPHDQKAETKEAITLLQPNTQIQAIGMLADIDEGTIKLLSETRGEYAPDA